jgi:c-di-GMP-related signal transduction protein
MKQLKLMLGFGVFIFGFAIQTFAQVVLPEVKVVSFNYKYLNAVDNKELAQPVKRLEMEAAAYDVKSSEYYEEIYDTYFVSFYIPEGSILAQYDKDGNLMRTTEKFKNIKIPRSVQIAVANKYPQWKIAKDVYLVSYFGPNEEASKRYKLLLENGDKRLRVKTNENGDFQ